jgi:asparagine synthase (glutamine-hydrolysing)
VCGIFGVLNRGGAHLAPEVAARMIGTLRHRGHDRIGEFATNAGTAPSVWFGFALLSIIDLSAAADQPMANEDGSVRIVFNGKVYNFQSLREELERKGHRFRSAGDAETVR